MVQWFAFTYGVENWEQCKHKVAEIFFKGNDGMGDIQLRPGPDGRTLLRIANSEVHKPEGFVLMGTVFSPHKHAAEGVTALA